MMTFLEQVYLCLHSEDNVLHTEFKAVWNVHKYIANLFSQVQGDFFSLSDKNI